MSKNMASLSAVIVCKLYLSKILAVSVKIRSKDVARSRSYLVIIQKARRQIL